MGSSEPLLTNEQAALCARFGVVPMPSPRQAKVGINENVRTGIAPLNGLRHPPSGDTSGWYIWAGELTREQDYFVPLHIEHVAEWSPEVEKFLGLPPGWRFLKAGDYEDVWFDETLLTLEE